MLLAIIIHDFTGSKLAAAAAALTMVAFYGFPRLATLGFNTKNVVVFLGVLSLYLQLKRRPALSGVFGALSVGYWNVSIVFPALALMLAFEKGGWKAGKRTLAGGLITAGVILVPVLLWGTFEAMIVEVIIAPLLLPEVAELRQHVMKFVTALGPLIWVVVPSVIVFLIISVRNLRAYWWILAGIILFSLHIFFYDFDSYPDMFTWMVFAALATGIVTGIFPKLLMRSALVLLLAAIIAVGILDPRTHPLYRLVTNPRSAEQVRAEGVPRMADIYWNQLIPETCYYRMAEIHRVWAERMEDTIFVTECDSVSISDALARLREAD